MLKNIFIGIGMILVIGVICMGILMMLSQRPIEKRQALTHLNKYFEKASKSKDDFSGIQAYVYSPKMNIDWQFAKGTSLRAGGLSVDQPFHVASVGKLFTATIIYQLAEEGKLKLDDPIVKTIAKDKLGRLFVYEGINESDKVTYRHLLSHTSGIADYFGGEVIKGEPMSKRLMTERDKIWQPLELLAFSEQNQRAVGVPGEKYLYSDTGYVLLGLLIESIEGKSFEKVLQERFFEPLEMNQSYMSMRSEPLSGVTIPIADLWLNGEEFGDQKALSVDWAGGGVISTTGDLMKFSIALHGGALISEQSLSNLFSNVNRFEQGIFTGDGGMTVRFKDFFPLLNLPLVKGHIGVLSTHVFYDPTTETHIVMNFGSTSKMVPSFKALIEILSVVKRIKP